MVNFFFLQNFCFCTGKAKRSNTHVLILYKNIYKLRVLIITFITLSRYWYIFVNLTNISYYLFFIQYSSQYSLFLSCLVNFYNARKAVIMHEYLSRFGKQLRQRKFIVTCCYIGDLSLFGFLFIIIIRSARHICQHFSFIFLLNETLRLSFVSRQVKSKTIIS